MAGMSSVGIDMPGSVVGTLGEEPKMFWGNRARTCAAFATLLGRAVPGKLERSGRVAAPPPEPTLATVSAACLRSLGSCSAAGKLRRKAAAASASAVTPEPPDDGPADPAPAEPPLPGEAAVPPGELAALGADDGDVPPLEAPFPVGPPVAPEPAAGEPPFAAVEPPEDPPLLGAPDGPVPAPPGLDAPEGGELDPEGPDPAV